MAGQFAHRTTFQTGRCLTSDGLNGRLGAVVAVAHAYMGFLIVLSVLTAAPASPETRFTRSPAFTTWLGDRALIDEQWLELPESKAKLVRFIAPTLAKQDVVPPATQEPFEDAWFLVDSTTGAIRAGPLLRSVTPSSGCPGPGDLAELSVASSNASRAVVSIGSGPQQCELRVTREHGTSWQLRLFPDETQQPYQNFPGAARALTESKLFRVEEAGSLSWSWVANTRWIAASSGASCRLWLIDTETNEVNWSASDVVSQALCECEENATGARDALRLNGAAPQFSISGDGTAIPSCECTLTASPDADCHTFAGRPHSPGELAMMEEEDPEGMQQRADGQRFQELEQQATALRDLLASNKRAKDAWSAQREDEALRGWRELYRQYVLLGRPAEEDSFGELPEEIAALRGSPLDLRHASVDLWAEILNNLGYALWAKKEFHQAAGAFAECEALLSRAGRERNVLNLNEGDNFRDLGDRDRAQAAYRRFLAGSVTPAQRRRATAELEKVKSH